MKIGRKAIEAFKESVIDHLIASGSFPGDESDITNHWLLMTRNIREFDGLRIQPPRRAFRCECACGFVLSIQAADGNYCTPQSNDGPWTAVECLPLEGRLHYRDEWDEFNEMTYLDDESLACITRDEPYSWVPVELVNRELKWHNKHCK